MFAQVFLNEHSRRGREMAPAVHASLRAKQIDYVVGTSADDVAARVDCIIACGGDGTIARGISAAVARGVPLGIVPLGTFNELARTLSLPVDVPQALDVIAEGAQRTIDVGRVNGRYFANEASIGISSRISRLQTSEIKQRFGIFAIIGTSLQAFRHARPIHCRVVSDSGEATFRTIQLTIANSHRFGGVVSVQDASIDDGWLDLYSVEIENFMQALPIARALLAGRREAVPGLRTIRSTRFEIHTHHAHRIAADGEPAGMTPAVFEILPKALRVYVRQ